MYVKTGYLSNIKHLIFVMWTFFDFFYRSICSLYIDAKDDGAEFAGVLIVALFQAFNILSVIMFFGVIIENTKGAYTSKLLVGFLLVSLIIPNYIRYMRIGKFKYEIINGKWEVKSSKTKVRIRILQTVYVLVSVLLLFCL